MVDSKVLTKGLRRQLAQRGALGATAVANRSAPVAIRSARPEDYAGIAGVVRRALPATYRGLLPSADIRAVIAAFRREGHEALVGAYRGGYLVAETDAGALVGFALAARGRLERAYVLSEYQGRGIGSAFLARRLAYLRAEGYRHAEAPELWANLPARRFLERRGRCCSAKAGTTGRGWPCTAWSWAMRADRCRSDVGRRPSARSRCRMVPDAA